MNSYDDGYTACVRTYSTLCIYPGEAIAPEDITRRLKVEPTSVQHIGERLGRTGRTIAINGWFLTTKDLLDSKDCRRHIDWILDRVYESKKELLWMQSEGFQAYIFRFWESRFANGGPTISPAQMARLSELNLDVSWDVYFARADE